MPWVTATPQNMIFFQCWPMILLGVPYSMYGSKSKKRKTYVILRLVRTTTDFGKYIANAAECICCGLTFELTCTKAQRAL
ncbi:UNVERIFIED_CONTAM: hypothetical protein NCL1_46466 [Trichonephila clavipes]